ncbi:putative membrane protein [hydrocarbon metagenome]|uniref:Putative membrane protein n=1 Tax=hydrocarbon metagenome TaxID=938273 RepID=A0A0W8E5Z6_9ZZZZ
MYLVASFHHCLHTEIAIAKVEELGIKKNQILAVPLEKKGETRHIFDTIHHADGISLFDGGAILGTIGMVFGVIYGFVLEWGPIIWGLIGLAGGFCLGFLLDLSFSKVRHSKGRQKENDAELFVMVHCDPLQADQVKKVLLDHLALGVAVVQGP